MAEYIEREKIYADISRFLIDKDSADLTDCEDGWTSAISKAMDVIKDLLAADVRPERHGEWIVDERNRVGFIQIECSECGLAIMTSSDPREWLGDENHQFCSRCGAKMREAENGRKGEHE